MPVQVQELQVIQAQLKELGIDMKIEQLEFGKLLADLSSTTSSRCGSAGRGGPIPTATSTLQTRKGGSSTRPVQQSQDG